VLIPLEPIGVKIGVWTHHRVPIDVFYNICYAALFFTGLKVTFDGVFSF